MQDATDDMHWASAVSDRVDSQAAIRQAASALLAERSDAPDLVMAFVSPHHAPAFEHIADWVQAELHPRAFIGASAAGVIGAGRELEGREGVVLTAAWLPDTQIGVTHLTQSPADGSRGAWLEALRLSSSATPQLMVFIDPYTVDVDGMLRGLDQAFPNAYKIGGLTSGSTADLPTALFVDATVQRGGALIVTLEGDFELTPIVAQGCRPIGDPFIVTRSRGNIIQELNAGKPTDVLRKLYDKLDARDHGLFNSSLFLGIEMTAGKRGTYEQGDFLIRNILGMDKESGAMAIDARPDDYQVVQFHLRDKDTSSQDLAQRLRVLTRLEEAGQRIHGGLLFACLGRGERLYGVPNHDSDLFHARAGAVSLSGFFCNGEIGPVGGKTFVHGYTSVFAVFSDRPKK